MTRARAAWLAAGVAVLLATAYLLQRRRRRPRVVTPAPVAVTVPRAADRAVAATTAPVEPVPDPPATPEEAPPVHAEVKDPKDAEQPLATWARVAIVGIALLAFFAVSLIATKRV